MPIRSRARLFVLLVIAIATPGSPILAAPVIRFAPAVPLSAGESPFALAGGDFNEDGHLDLAVGTAEGGEVGLWLGDASGRLPPPRTRYIGEDLLAGAA